MVGCRGNVGYIFLPGGGSNFEYRLNRHTCSLPSGATPFDAKNGRERGGTNLPNVNSVVALQTGTRLFQEQDIADNVDQFHVMHGERTAAGNECHVVWSQPDKGDGIGPRAKVKILGYRTMLGQERISGTVRTVKYSTQLLFALVQVIQD